jgi:hypothetical protein
MPLTLPPPGLSRDPDANDSFIYEDGVEIGRLYEIGRPPGRRAGGAFFLSRLSAGELRPALGAKLGLF